MQTISLVNNKGGVGKTTTAVNLAAGLARRGYRTLLVDLDSQANATVSLNLDIASIDTTAADMLLDSFSADEAIHSSYVDGLDVLAGDPALANTDASLAGEYGREMVLKRALRPIGDQYDFALIDSPASFSLVTVNALVASDQYLVPVTPDYLTLEGVASLLDRVEAVRDGIGEAAELLGFVLTKVDYRAGLTGEVVDELRQTFGDQVFESEIRINIRLAEAPSHGQSIYDYDGSSTGAKAYTQLTDELLERL